MTLTIQILLLLLCLFTGLQMVRLDHWWVRVSDFTHLQVCVLTAICLLLHVLLIDLTEMVDWLLVGGGLMTFTYQMLIILPYTRFYPKAAGGIKRVFDDEQISILEANVYMENKRYDRLLDLIAARNPDVVITLETGQRWSEALSALDSDYPYTVKVPLDNTYGMLLFSKLALSDTSIHYLIEDNVPSIETNIKLSGGTEVKLYVVHPKPPSPTENPRSTERDAELIVVARQARDQKMPVIVAGDLNDVAWSHTSRLFQRISRLLDPRIGRGFFNTYNAKYPLLRWPLDHVFHSDDFLVRRILRLPDIGSDHFPLFIQLVYKPITGPARNSLPEQVDQQDIEESIETLQAVAANHQAS